VELGCLSAGGSVPGTVGVVKEAKRPCCLNVCHGVLSLFPLLLFVIESVHIVFYY